MTETAGLKKFMKPTNVVRNNRKSSNEEIARKAYKLLSKFVTHKECCHSVSWGGYCDCGLLDAKKNARELLRMAGTDKKQSILLDHNIKYNVMIKKGNYFEDLKIIDMEQKDSTIILIVDY